MIIENDRELVAMASVASFLAVTEDEAININVKEISSDILMKACSLYINRVDRDRRLPEE